MDKSPIKIIALLILLHFTPVEAAVVSITNSLPKDDEGNLLEVERITTEEGTKGRFRLKIYPGETKVISGNDVIGFQVSRIFEAHKLRYEISCEQHSKNRSLTFDFDQIHEGKLGKDCKLTGYGHWSRRTGLNWIMKKSSIIDKHKTIR